MLICFVLGSRGLTPRRRHLLSDQPDIMWLDVEEPGILTMTKVFSWWRVAASAAHLFTHAMKLDDDSFVHVPNLLADVRRAADASPHLVYAPIAYAGYNPQIFRMCGWTWQRSDRPWKARGCAARGMVRPFPFPLGALQLLSTSLVRAVGTSADVAAFSDAANTSAALRGRESNEDVALGYWIWRQRLRLGLNVSFVTINARATNLGCFRNGGLYRHPKPDAVVIHRIKGGAGMHYVWGMLHDGKPHDEIKCAREAAIELPRNSIILQPQFEAKVRSGMASVSFNPKTNMISMRFKSRFAATSAPNHAAKNAT